MVQTELFGMIKSGLSDEDKKLLDGAVDEIGKAVDGVIDNVGAYLTSETSTEKPHETTKPDMTAATAALATIARLAKKAGVEFPEITKDEDVRTYVLGYAREIIMTRR